MARVVLPRAITNAFEVESEWVIETDSVRALLRELESRIPGISTEIHDAMSIAIDGEIYSDALLEDLDPDAEVHFVPRLRGG